MAVEKLSISFEARLAAAVRRAAAAEGLTVSTWIAEAAEAKARQAELRAALDELAREHGTLSDDEIDDLVTEARGSARYTGRTAAKPHKRTAKKRG